MFNDNPFRDIKTNPILPITEGAVDKAADHFNVVVSADGETWQHHSGKGPKYTSDELIQKYSEHLKEKKPRGSADDAYAGLNPTGVGTPEGSSNRFENTDLFPKNWEINLREHIRNEYSNRGYDATTVEVQETYNHVVSMLNERNQANKEASRVAEIKRGREVLGRDYGFDEDMISAARNSKAGLDPENYFTRRSEHKTKRGARPEPRTEREVGLNRDKGPNSAISMGLATLSGADAVDSIERLGSKNHRIGEKRRLFTMGKATLPTAATPKGPSPSSPAREISAIERRTRQGT